MTALLLVAGLVLLVAGGESLVRGAGNLARTIGMSPLIVGLTVVAFATSAPELAVSIGAAINGYPGLAVGNIVGSNISNVLLILGLSALFVPLAVKSQVVRADIPVMIGLSAGLLFATADGRISRLDGIVLFASMVVYVSLTVVVARRRRYNGLLAVKATRGRPTRESADEPAAREPSRRRSTLTSLGFIVFGAVLLVVGAQLLVGAATTIAQALGVSDLVIGLTIVAIGTSLPELAASIVAVIRGERDLAVGNIVGSNVFNIGMVLGLTALASPDGISVTADAAAFHLPILLATALVLLPVTLTKMTVSRLEGALFVGFYTAYIGYLVLESLGYVTPGPLGLMMLGFVVPITAMWLVLLVINEWDTLRSRGSGLFNSDRAARAVRRHARSE